MRLGSGHGTALAGIADKAFVANEMHGWVTGFVKGRIAGRNKCFGGKSNRETAITILKAIVRHV